MENTPSPFIQAQVREKAVVMDILSFFPPWFLPITLLIFFPSILMYTILSKRSSINLPPGPKRRPVIGNLHQVVGENMHQTLWNLSQTYGPTMLLYFGSQPFLVISSSEIAGEVLRTHDQKLCTRSISQASKRLTFNYMDVAFSPQSDHCKEMRKVLVSDFLGPKRGKLYRKVIETEMEGLVGSLTSDLVNVDDMIQNIVYEVVCKVAFGSSCRDKTYNGRTLKEIAAETLEMMGNSLSDNFPTFGPTLDRLRGWNRRLEKVFSDLDGFLQMIIDQHEIKSNDSEKDFIDDCSSRLTNDELKALMMNVVEGAIDTTAITMVWVFSEIVRNPRIMEKLQNEIRSCVGRKASIHESDLTKMTYLKMVVKETLRLHPPVHFLMLRESTSHSQIGGYDILPGTRILVNSWGIGRDPRIWNDGPTEFRPERFENAPLEYFGGTNFDMIPFGGGRRACPGYNFGTSTTEFVIANLLYFFNWETPNGVKNEDLDMEEDGSSFLRRKRPLWLVPVKHNWQN